MAISGSTITADSTVAWTGTIPSVPLDSNLTGTFLARLDNALQALLNEASSSNHANRVTVVKITFPAIAAGAAGDLGSAANPFGAPAVVLDVVVDITDAGAEAETFDAGVGALATTSSDDLLDGQALNAVATLNNTDDAGGSGGRNVKMSATQFITVSASGSLTSFAGTLTATIAKLA